MSELIGITNFADIPTKNSSGKGGRPASKELNIVRNLKIENGQKQGATFRVDMRDGEDFQTSVKRLVAKFRRPGALDFDIVTRTNKQDSTVTIIRSS
jgi:hypothetical protein